MALSFPPLTPRTSPGAPWGHLPLVPRWVYLLFRHLFHVFPLILHPSCSIPQPRPRGGNCSFLKRANHRPGHSVGQFNTCWLIRQDTLGIPPEATTGCFQVKGKLNCPFPPHYLRGFGFPPKDSQPRMPELPSVTGHRQTMEVLVCGHLASQTPRTHHCL